MSTVISPVETTSLKEACVRRLEQLILSGELGPGEKLPPERQLAAQLDVSRPVVHQSLVELEARGLVEIVPRRGVRVSDFRQNGSVALLESLLRQQEGQPDPVFMQDMLAFRRLLECETARLAARQRSAAHLQRLNNLLKQEAAADQRDVKLLTQLDFTVHLEVALASGNMLYPMILNSFKRVYINLSEQFFNRVCGTPVVDEVFAFHRALLTALENGSSAEAAAVMGEMLQHGADLLMDVET